MPEMCDVYDEHGMRTGRTWPRRVPMKSGDYHLVVYAWILSEDGKLLMTQRHPEKASWGGYWECTAGGVQAGETSLDGALRELREEIGMVFRKADASFLHRIMDGNTLIDTWLFLKSPVLSDLRLQPEEVTGAKWVSRQEYETMCRQGLVVPFCTHFYEWREEKESCNEYCDGKTVRHESASQNFSGQGTGMQPQKRPLRNHP